MRASGSTRASVRARVCACVRVRVRVRGRKKTRGRDAAGEETHGLLACHIFGKGYFNLIINLTYLVSSLRAL